MARITRYTEVVKKKAKVWVWLCGIVLWRLCNKPEIFFAAASHDDLMTKRAVQNEEKSMCNFSIDLLVYDLKSLLQWKCWRGLTSQIEKAAEVPQTENWDANRQ